MKNLAASIILSIVIFGCSKSNQKTISTTPPSTTSSSMSTAEQSLVGNWILRKIIECDNTGNVEYNYANYYNTTTYVLYLQNTTKGSYYSCISGIDESLGFQANASWHVNSSLPNTLTVGSSTYNILFQSSDSLVLVLFGNTSNNTYKYFLNKTNYSCTQSTKEQLAVKTWVMYQTCLLDGSGNTSTTIPANNSVYSYSLTLQNTWGTGGGVAGWNCIAGTGTPLYNGGTTYWEIIGADSLYVTSKGYYKINTLNSGALTITTIPAASGESYYFH